MNPGMAPRSLVGLILSGLMLVTLLAVPSATTQGAVARLPAGVSLGLAPYGGDLAHVAESARASGSLPMKLHTAPHRSGNESM